MKYKDRPCPGGCGSVEARPPQRLCRDCQRQLKLGQRREREIVSLARRGAKIRVAIDTAFAYGLTTRGVIGILEFSHTDVVDTLVRLAGLEDASGSGGTYKAARPIHFNYSIPYHFRPRQFVWATPEQADAIELILDYIREMCEKWSQAGFNAGHDLLQQIARSGVEEMNRITMMKETGR